MARVVRGYLGDLRETYCTTDGLVSRQVIDGFTGYAELLSAPEGRRIYWGYRKHAGLTCYAVLHDADGGLVAIAVRSLTGDYDWELHLYLPAGRDSQAEEAILRDWSPYMVAFSGRYQSDPEVRIVRVAQKRP